MELASQKRAKICKRKRLAKNRRRNQRKFEVRSSKRRKGFNISWLSTTQDDMNFPITTAHTFWENYKIAQDWQKKHNVAWWKSRCMALEYENNILREKVRQLGQHGQKHHNHFSDEEEEEEAALEFQVDEDMLNFLEHSIRHKMELKKTRQYHENTKDSKGYNDSEVHMPEMHDCEKIANAQDLYGSAAGMKIIAMETALQVSLDRYKDLCKPHYWPNIPLKA